MDVDSPVLSFSEHNLHGIEALVGFDDCGPLAQSDINVGFSNLICVLCNELSSLYGIKDTIFAMKSDEDVNGFLLDLSVFLSQLECPLESICCGPIENRFSTADNRKILILFLLHEIKSARLHAKAMLSKSCTKSVNNDDIWENVKNSLNLLSVSKPAVSPTPRDIISAITTATDSRLKSYTEKPVPLFKDSIDSKRSLVINKVISRFNHDCHARNLLLLKRIDVTINSFLWASRIRVHENNIMNLFATKRKAFSQVYVSDIADVLAATQYITKIERASSTRRRAKTRSIVHPLADSAPPADRGGRTTDMTPAPSETFKQQQGTRNTERSRGHGSYHGRGNKNGQRNISNVESQVRQEFVNRYENICEGHNQRGELGGNLQHRGGRRRY